MSHVKTTFKAGIARVVMARPEKKNAITTAMYQALGDAIQAAVADPDTRVIVLMGAGGHFTSGNDLHDFLANPDMTAGSPVYHFLQSLMHCPLPVVAAVQGFAIGIGSTLLLHCEYVIAGESARFAFPFINLGLVPEAGSSFLLPQRVGYQCAADLLLRGESISAEEARAAGLVSRVVADDELESSAMVYAGQLAVRPRESLIAVKALLRRDAEPLQQRVEVELQQFIQCLQSAPAQEAMAAFLEKRQPVPGKL